jgi:hypothetical protein
MAGLACTPIFLPSRLPLRVLERRNSQLFAEITLVASYSLDHDLESRVDYRASLLQIEVPRQFGRSFDVREQRGHGFARAIDLSLKSPKVMA